MKKLLKNLPLLILSILATSGMMIVNRLDIPGSIHTLGGSLDAMIPFIPFFIFFYLVYFPFVYFFWGYFYLSNSPYFKIFAYTITVTGIITVLFNIFFQTTAPRYTIYGTDFFSKLVQWTYTLNEPKTSFPSLHVSQSLIVSFFAAREFPKYAKLLWTTAILISLSTLFVKHHYLPDALAGLVIGLGLSILFSYYFSKNTHEYSKNTA